MIAPTMMRIAAPRIAIAISPALYLVFFFAGPVCECPPPFFFFFRSFFDMTQSFYRETGNSPSLQDVMTCEGAE